MKMKQKVMMLTMGVLLSTSLAHSSASADSIKVQKGNTLWNLSKKHNVNVETLKKLNNLTSNNIYIGQTLQVSSAVSNKVKASTKVATSSNTYTVKKGDSLFRIGKTYGISVQSIKKSNNLSSDTIRIGQKLTLNGVSSNAKNTSTASISSSIPKAVKGVSQSERDNLISFAKKFIGTPYKWGGTTPNGFDCSGFMYYILKKHNQTTERHSVSTYWSKTKKVTKPVEGDLVFFQNTYKSGPSHMGVYLGNGSFIHAGSDGIEIAKVNSSYWSKHLLGYGTTF